MIWTGLIVANYALVVVALLVLLRRRNEPRAMMAWALALVLLPGLGLFLFSFFGESRLKRRRRRRIRRRRKLHASLARRVEARRGLQATHESVKIAPGLTNLVTVATRLTNNPPTHGNAVTIYYDAEKTFLALQMAIEGAQSHIHLEYYIFQPDDTGRAVRDLLCKRARDGVRCRVLLDSIGCWRVPRSFLKPFRDAGVDVAFFFPVLAWRGRWRVNFRNHRKLAVFDGTVAFTGSQNIGDEYLGRRRRLGPWRDTHLRLEGPCVQELQEVFVEDWHYTTGEDLVSDDYFPPLRQAGNRVVQNVPSGPDGLSGVLHQLLFAAVAAARRSVCIATPYFVPDGVMLVALQSAALRGVRVQILVPTRSDRRITLWASRSFYEELCSAGVEIYEYDAGMLHSKVVVIDEAWALVGSANMDERSFRLTFEITTILYDQELALNLQEDFDSLKAKARKISSDGRVDWTFLETIKLGVARMASPLL